MNNQAEGRQTQTCPVTVDVKRSPTNKSVIYVSGELLRGATSTMRRIVADELNRSPALLALDRCQAADAKFPRVTVHELRHTAAQNGPTKEAGQGENTL